MIKMIKATEEITLTFARLHLDSLHIRVSLDASYATNIDMSSQITYIVLLTDSTNACNVLVEVPTRGVAQAYRSLGWIRRSSSSA